REAMAWETLLGLAALEDRLPLLLERPGAFLGVLRSRDRDADLHLLLERLDRRPPETGQHRALHSLDGERAIATDDLGAAARFGEDLSCWHDSVDEADAQRLGRGELLTHEQDLHRVAE